MKDRTSQEVAQQCECFLSNTQRNNGDITSIISVGKGIKKTDLITLKRKAAKRVET